MLNRRNFLTSALALGALGAAPAWAQQVARAALPQRYLPRRVTSPFAVEPGEIHVDPNSYKLYWTLPQGRAIEYSVGVGRDNLYEDGTFFIGAKKEWPSWTPTKDMIARQPELYAPWAGGMPGGPNNPLGARALYLFTKERGDTFLRIHGTNLPETIGSAVSNGCTRLVNDHIIELYEKVPVGTRVVLHPKTSFGQRTFGIATPDNAAAENAPSEPERLCRDVLGRTVRCNPN